MYVITGATGNTGSKIAQALLKAGKEVKVISRKAENVENLVKSGAKSAIGSLEDTDFLTQALEGATAVYAMLPPNFTAPDFRAYQNTIDKSLAQAIKNAGVKHAISLSSVGAHLGNGAGVVDGVADLEKYLNEIPDLNVVHLRPTFFMENFYGNIGLIKQAGIAGFSAKGNLKIPMIATKDIAEVAVKLFLDLNFTGQSIQYILGAKDYTFDEATAILGKAIGKENLPYVSFPYEDAEKAMVEQMGASLSLAKAYSQFFKSLNDGKITEDVKRDSKNTSPTTLEAFAKEFAVVYQNS